MYLNEEKKGKLDSILKGYTPEEMLEYTSTMFDGMVAATMTVRDDKTHFAAFCKGGTMQNVALSSILSFEVLAGIKNEAVGVAPIRVIRQNPELN